jgi:DNA-binding helix-hairpin-helix protein with protein kinase domain
MQVLRRLPNQEEVAINLTVSLGRGGEACVYTVPTDANVVAKVYHKPTEQQAQKLAVMLAHPPENPTVSLGHTSIAWPYEILRSADGSDRIVGFLMPRIRGMRPIIDFYNPRTRRQHCPLFSYQYLLRTARNLAAAFAALHNRGYCVGDVNESNILVSDTALVTLVDTDSFQVSDPDSRLVYRCPVGKPEFTPPELQNRVFAECDRAIAHDLFGLSVLIFQLLMEGTHPFSGIYQGAGEPPQYEARIAAGHFTYSQKRRIPYIPTPIAPDWGSLHPGLQELFRRCFEEGHNNPLMRPSAATWMLTLRETEEALVSCTKNPQHRYGSHLHDCPWCERTVRLGGRDPFPSPQAVANKEHLQTRTPQRHRQRQNRQIPSNVLPLNRFNYLQQHPTAQNNNYYKQAKKPKYYPVIFCVVALGFLGCVDFLTKLSSRPINSQTAYIQQNLATNTSDNQSFDDYYKQGHASYKIKDYDQAAIKFSQAIQKDPNNSKAYINRGNARYNLKEYEAALADYSRALKINPDEIKAHVNRGNVRLILADYSNDRDREYKLALKDFDNALQINPSEVEAYIRRGVVHSQIAKYSGESQQDYQKAIEDFNQALNINPSRAEAYFQRGAVRYQIAQYSSKFEQEYKLAIEDFNQAVNLNSKFAKAYLKRGIVRYELAQFGGKNSGYNHTQAVNDLQQAAKISQQQSDTENYQQAVSGICVVVENKCDAMLQNQSSPQSSN